MLHRHREWIHTEQVNLLAMHSPIAYGVSLLNMLLIILLLGNSTPPSALLSWTAFMGVVTLCRYMLVRMNQHLINEINEHRQTKSSLQEAIHAAETAARTKATFLATMSHEIRTP